MGVVNEPNDQNFTVTCVDSLRFSLFIDVRKGLKLALCTCNCNHIHVHVILYMYFCVCLMSHSTV